MGDDIEDSNDELAAVWRMMRCESPLAMRELYVHKKFEPFRDYWLRFWAGDSDLRQQFMSSATNADSEICYFSSPRVEDGRLRYGWVMPHPSTPGMLDPADAPPFESRHRRPRDWDDHKVADWAISIVFPPKYVFY